MLIRNHLTIFIIHLHVSLSCLLFCRGICAQEDVYLLVEDIIPSLAQAYLHVFNKACNSDTLFRHIDDGPSENILKAREFFGLRDFYRFLKLINFT